MSDKNLCLGYYKTTPHKKYIREDKIYQLEKFS